MDTLVAPDEGERIRNCILAGIATRLHFEHNLATRAALETIVDSLLDDMNESKKVIVS